MKNVINMIFGENYFKKQRINFRITFTFLIFIGKL
jgi:hypothetical protein